MQNIFLDDLVIGAGPSALGLLAAQSDQSRKRQGKIGVITGADFAHPSLGNSVIGPLEGARSQCHEIFGLPAVRAFGPGGTSKLWHGGLFFPQSADCITDLDGRDVSLDIAFERLKESPALRTHPIQSIISQIPRELSKTIEPHWRNIFIPRGNPMLLSAVDIASDSAFYIDDGSVSRLEQISNGVFQTRVVGKEGIRNIVSERVFIAAGCIGTMHILVRSGFSERIPFNDHLHVFAGVLDKSNLEKSLSFRLSPSYLAGTSYATRAIWKTSLTFGGKRADVGLGFRSVADPNFPRSGRAIGNLIGHRAASARSKVMLGLKNPQTSIEMLAYKYGIELPFRNLLIHATVSLRDSVGAVSRDGIDFAPDVDAAAAFASEAMKQFYSEHEIETGRSAKIFEISEMRQSIISGAQFSGSVNTQLDLPQGLVMVDPASFGYTSIYNQTLLTLAHAYSLGQDGY